MADRAASYHPQQSGAERGRLSRACRDLSGHRLARSRRIRTGDARSSGPGVGHVLALRGGQFMSGYVIVVDFKLHAGKYAAFRTLIDENARASAQSEPGCRRFDVLEPK